MIDSSKSCWGYPCRDEGCPFDNADDAPADCPRTAETRHWIANVADTDSPDT